MRESVPAYNTELKQLSVALRFNARFLRFLCRAGGAEITASKANGMLRRAGDAKSSPCPRELLQATLEGIIIWQRDYDGDQAAFAHAVASEYDMERDDDVP